ncbi:MAG TPA: dihydrolipoamide acetyltransferase family protein [Symbiobacteriaceae bacterium]|nr:dihydrolipoamide acetyltransferase family protein [Symbiobacteriaceae bacterium]
MAAVHEFCLPEGIGPAGAEGAVINWFKDEGQPVKAGELLLEVQFEKVASEVCAPADGVLSRILCAPGEAVRAGQPLCLILPAAVEPTREVRATPAARRVARELSGAQRITGERMLQSLRETAQFTLLREAVVTALMALREKARQAGDPWTLSDLLHRAVVLALAEHPLLQAVHAGDHLVLPEEIHLGFAVARGDDLLVPVIRSAGGADLRRLSAERRRLTAAVLGGQAAPADFEGATFTVSNLGLLGADAFTPVLNPPQPAILGVGRAVERPVVREGQVVPGWVLTLCLTVDHRVINGAPAARFLDRLATLLGAPEGWVSV